MLGKEKAKYIQSLGQKKFRDQERLFIAEGPKIVGELLQFAPESVKAVYAVNGWLNQNVVQPDNKLFNEVGETELQRISQLKTPNQVIAIVRQFEPDNELVVKGKISLVLHIIQDPGNLGTIIRTADWFGVSQIICSDDCADVYNPKVVQATMGSIARVKVFYVEMESWLGRQKNVTIYAATLKGKNITSIGPLKEGLIVLGNESKGIGENILALCNEKITIRRNGAAESLNVAVATGIILSRLT